MSHPRACQALSLYTARAALVSLGLLTGCSSGSGSTPPVGDPNGDFVLLRTIPSNNGRLFLNESIVFEFSQPVDVESADSNSVSFTVFDLLGVQLSESVEGSFRVTTATGDTEPGRRLEFMPRFPAANSFTDGGFKPARRYVVNLLRGDHRRNVGLLDVRGKGLRTAYSFQFQTADGTTPGELFRDTRPGGPRLTGFSVTPTDPRTGEAELNELGQAGTEIRARFDQPLNPHSDNLPIRLDLDPRVRGNDRGRVFLEYDDVTSGATWIPAVVTLEENSLEGATLVLRPLGILPNHAEVRFVVQSDLEDLSGESNAGDRSYEPVVARFATSSGYELRFDAMVEDFLDSGNLDFTAAVVEPLADVRPGLVRANLDFDGQATHLDYQPRTREVVLDTDFTSITPSNGQPINVSNGRFVFRNVTIPPGSTVRGTGTRPMVWLCTGDFRVAGELRVDGGDGARVNTLNSANAPAPGGTGNCGGGRGGSGSPKTADRSFRGEPGYGPGGVPNGGGQGGEINCADPACGSGSGGGGGAFATQGDEYYPLKATADFVQPTGKGGWGCRNRQSKVRPGGNPGVRPFTDTFEDNDFWGAAVDLHRGRRITGELREPLGGQGGGGGGDFAQSCQRNDPNFINDQKGGGGGAGGGVLIIKALGDIVVERTGYISANGGDGGGGAQAGSSDLCGGGGAGSGGMIVLMAGGKIDIHVHGETYAEKDYDFPISADGGVGRLDGFGGGGIVRGKYPPTSVGNMNRRPSGGFGGLGIVQLMAPAGPNPGEPDDGTNTVLDDNIVIRDGAEVKTGAAKQRYIGWRGLPNDAGVKVDDQGRPVRLGDAVGDIRPAPLLMPAPFGRRSRVVSHWIDLGAAARRMTAAGGDGRPRGVDVQPGLSIGATFGPLPEFAAVETGPVGDRQAGFLRVVDDNAGGARVDYPSIVTDLEVARVEPGVRFRGRDAVRVTLGRAAPALGEADRYSHYAARGTDGGSTLFELRILGHSAETLYLAPDPMPDPVTRPIRLAVLAKFFDVVTGGVEGLPEAFVGRSGANRFIPRGNVRLRFAFHQDPADSSAKRFPPGRDSFFADWDDQAALEELRAGGYRFLKFDLLFDLQYQWTDTMPNNRSLTPDTPRIGLRRLVLPFRY